EQAQRVLDIATLTGAAGMTFGKHMAPMLADGEEFYEEFVRAQEISGEHYVRLPFYKAHERMIESKWADVKNTGGDTCGTITAGLFIRVFAEGRQWIHLDIAGTAEAYDSESSHAFYSYGGTGAGASTMYALCC
ncbi:MAG: leucyl aminopeptidase family protein, partial [Lachnospiraceae bacterium]|nr:leucyl aminopeptidase family protein [Lachnospiraceae bacterium]